MRKKPIFSGELCPGDILETVRCFGSDDDLENMSFSGGTLEGVCGRELGFSA